MSNLVAALKEINRRPVGIDGIRFEAYACPRDYALWDPNVLHVDAQLNLLNAVQESLTYGALPDATEAFRLKDRWLERGTVSNRICERAFLRKLNANLDRGFNDCSWGYRPGRSPEMAILRVRRAVRGGAHWAVKTDFKHFFRHVERSILESQLRKTIPDQALCDALLNTVAPVVVIDGKSMDRLAGLPEGNGVSPFLANFYLGGLDKACSHLNYYRYADDVLVLGRTREEVQEALDIIRALAAKLGLKLNAKKTAILDLYREPVVFLGYELRGGNLWPPPKAIERFEKKLLSRGQEDREQLMKGFVRRFSIGPVRKLFRRLDRRFAELFPPGVTLVGLLDGWRAESFVSDLKIEAITV
jgi:retron-type reverse transcriptase